MSNGVRRAGLDAVAAEDAAVVVDVIDSSVAFGAADAILFCILGGFDVNAVRWACGCAEKAGYALFQSILVALEDMQSAKALLELGAAEWTRPVGIVLDDRRLKHLLESDGH